MSDMRQCFVIMPFGEKSDAEGNKIDFSVIYEDLIRKPVTEAGLKCIRCDEMQGAGVIHDDMFRMIATADVAVVDLSLLNPNVFYELGARHALKDKVTVLIKSRGTGVPFNIQSLRIIEYPSETGCMGASRQEILDFINLGLERGESDSPWSGILAKVQSEQAETDLTERIREKWSSSYFLKSDPQQRIEIRTGDMIAWRGVDIWVNSENTNMQMARFYDRNLSAIIRYNGAERDENDNIVKDTIADQLSDAMGARGSVNLGSVLVTSGGCLERTHGVKMVFHVAAVSGVPGEGYRSASGVAEICVRRSLERFDSASYAEVNLSSIAFPMLGTGSGGGDVYEVAELLIDTAVGYLEEHPDSRSRNVIFMAWNGRDLEACTNALDRNASLTADRGSSGT